MTEKMYDITIVGARTDCWAIALLLARQLKVLKPRIAVINLAQADDKDLIVSASPSIRRFNHLLGISEKELIRRLIAWPALGVDIHVSARENMLQFFHSYEPGSSEATDLDWPVIANKVGCTDIKPDDLSLAATMTRMGKFIDPERVAHAAYQSLGVGLNIHLARYVDLLRELAIDLGVVEFVAHAVSCHTKSNQSLIDSLYLDSGQEISSGLFIDRSSIGLVGDNTRSERAISITSKYSSGNKSGLTSTRLQVLGNQFFSFANIESTCFLCCHKIHSEGVSSANNCVDNVIDNTFNFSSEKKAEEIERIERFNFEDRAFWNGNCIRIPATATLPWDMITGYDEIGRQSMLRLLECYASPDAMSGASEEFNRLSLNATRQYQQLIVIFLMLTSALLDEELKSLVEPAIYEEVVHSIKLFKSAGILSSYLSPLQSRAQWVGLFVGFGLVPETSDPCFESYCIKTLSSMAARRLTQVKDASEKCPTLDEYIRYFLRT